MAIALVTSVIAQSSNGNTFTSGAVNTAGSTGYAAVVADYISGPGITFSDSQSHTWSARTAYNSAGTGRIRVYDAIATSTSASHTFTVTGNGAFAAVVVLAFSGTHATTFYDGNENGASATATTIQPGSVTPSQDNCVVVSGLVMNAASLTAAINSGFTIAQQGTYAGGVHYGIACAYKIQTAAGAENPTWSWGGTTELMGANSAVFRSTSPGSGAIITSPSLRFRGVRPYPFCPGRAR